MTLNELYEWGKKNKVLDKQVVISCDIEDSMCEMHYYIRNIEPNICTTNKKLLNEIKEHTEWDRLHGKENYPQNMKLNEKYISLYTEVDYFD